MIIVFAFVLYIYFELYDILEKMKQSRHAESIPDIQDESLQENDLYSNQLLIMHGIGRPVEHCEIQEVKKNHSDCPSEWIIEWKDTVDDRGRKEYDIVDITLQKAYPRALK